MGRFEAAVLADRRWARRCLTWLANVPVGTLMLRGGIFVFVPRESFSSWGTMYLMSAAVADGRQMGIQCSQYGRGNLGHAFDFTSSMGHTKLNRTVPLKTFLRSQTRSTNGIDGLQLTGHHRS